MGVIEGGAVAGIVADERFFAVNYPGYPSSLARATQTLGGEESIAKAWCCDGTYLELKFRPEDPYAHAAFGEVHQTSDLLLRIKKKKKSSSSSSRSKSGTTSCTPTNSATTAVVSGGGGGGGLSSTTIERRSSSSPADDDDDNASRSRAADAAAERRDGGAGDYEIHADIVARIENTYNFDGMADYQYVLAVHADAAKHKRKRKRDEKRFEKGGLMDMEQEELMMLVPPLFSLKDMPEETVLRPSDFTNKKMKKQTVDGSLQTGNTAPCFGLDFKIKEVPAPTWWEEKLVRGSVEYQLTAVVAHYFDKQPIWARATLTDCLADQGLDLTTFQIKRLLFRTAFYFGYGPFRTLWIKTGYDPRKDPESRMYQMMDFRIPRAVRESGHAPERPQKDPEWRDICSFRVAPQKKFSHLQLHDLKDDFIQEQIRKPAERSSCSEYTGWFRRATLERIRQHIRVRFLALIPGEVARELELVEARSLERFKSGKGGGVSGVSTGMENLQDEGENNTTSLNVPGDSQLATASESNAQQLGDLQFKPMEHPFPTAMPSQKELAQGDGDNGRRVKEHELPGEDDEEDAEVELGKGGDDEEDEEDEEDVEDDEEEDDEEDEEEEEDDEIDLQQEPREGSGNAGLFGDSTDKIPDGFLQELLQRFPFAGNSSPTPGNDQPITEDVRSEDDEYAIYEQDDEDDD